MTALHAGDQLDHYKIESLVARSGMASIFKATDVRTGRQVAVKVPHPEMESDLTPVTLLECEDAQLLKAIAVLQAQIEKQPHAT